MIDLIHAVLRPEPEERIASLEILNPFSEKDGLNDKLSVVDIKAHDQVGRLYNVEMQMLGPVHFPKRLAYYAAKIHQPQLHEGEPYGELRPTILICFLNDTLFPQLADVQLTFQLWDQEHRVVLTDDLAIHLLELPKFDKQVGEVSDERDRWLYCLRNAAQIDDEAVPPSLDAPPIRKAMEVLNVLTQDDLERERYEARLKLQRDAISNLESVEKAAHEKGRKEGRKEGLKEGRKKGKAFAIIQLCETQLGRRVTPEEELQALSKEELEQRASALENELFGAPPSAGPSKS